MKLNYLFLSGLMASASAALGLTNSHIVHEKRNLNIKSIFAKGHALPGSSHIPVRIALKQRNLDKGMDYLMAVSDPISPSYGEHYTPEQVVELFKPSDESISIVKRWLVQSGVAANSIVVPKSKGWIAFDSTVEQLEDVLKTKYYTYHHISSGVDHIGVDEYSLPEHVSEHVDFVSPALAMMRKRSADESIRSIQHETLRPLRRSTAPRGNDTTNCSGVITPTCIKAMYNIPPGTDAHPDNKMGIFETNDSTYAQEDLDSFFSGIAGHQIPKGTHPDAYIIGQTTASGPATEAGGEATLDYEMAYPIIWPQNIVDLQARYSKSHGASLFNTFLDAIDGSYCTYEGGDDPEVDGTDPNRQCGTFKAPNVISISYGLAEAYYPTNYQKRQCEEFMKLGLQGTSLFVASGDHGVAEHSCQGPNKDIFSADQASGCPYVTAVGATELPANTTAGDEEHAASKFGSGGGFSNIFPQPDYQKQAVSQWFKDHDPGFKNYSTKDGVIPTTGGIYNAGGRGYPDISAIGQDGLIWVRGFPAIDSGTSMSAPIIGAIINRINEERLKIGKGPVGFVNPVLYKYPEMFNDIVLGGISNDAYKCNGKAFNASSGWDPVTGMGTPKYDKMLKRFLELK